MLRKFLLTAALALTMSSAALADSVIMGKTEDGITVFFDTDVKPVAYVDKDGARVMADGVFTENYYLYKVIGKPFFPINSMYDAKARRTFEMAVGAKDEWLDDKAGGDGFLFGAYVVRDYAKIMIRRPFVLKTEFLPATRTPMWAADERGWQKAYEREDGGQAWVQTKSAILSFPRPGRLPHVRVLTRRLETDETGKPKILFSYESYDPQKRTKQILKAWDKDLKEIATDTAKLYKTPVLSKDAAIASLGYLVFILDHEQTRLRVQFMEGEDAAFIKDSWFDFEDK